MTNVSTKKANKKSLFLLFGIILTIGLIFTYRSDTVEREGRYTIATVYKVQGARGGLRIDYEYIFQDQSYTGYAVSTSYSHNDVGKRLFIKVLPNDPDRCLITDIRVPDSITEAPVEGWVELPVIPLNLP
ncbi:hypothetical protein [Dysgonomonas sp. HGC4]|uniref:hypothetical protein n=1 Tax=Dysgonomonas sp. HGC4 TaxID=1658009 RepID=UPI000683300C|nr:hypothetical protein [Dysgonomonas sp. HGC4]MBD8347026.1 hypothetical protein [Dysgonomonas sp. HGC4]